MDFLSSQVIGSPQGSLYQARYAPSLNTHTLPELEVAEASYALAWQLEEQGSPACVDHYFQAAAVTLSWVEAAAAQSGHDASSGRAWVLHHSSLAKLITTSQQYGRFHPRRGLLAAGPTARTAIPIRYVGFPWRAEDFATLSLVGQYRAEGLTTQHRRHGIGVPLVVTTPEGPSRPYIFPQARFAATAVLRRDAEDHGAHAGFTLAFYDPLRVTCVPCGHRALKLASDITAPIAYAIVHQDSRAPLEGFLRPDDSQPGKGLSMLEPYQPGKIPLVFVHGLLSVRLTWAELGNEIRARPDLVDQYQIWTFAYSTGQPFLKSAAELRQQLRAVRHELDPGCQDAALDRMVLVGHSMGGLVSKLLITYSESRLWNAIANRPLEAIRTDGQTAEQLCDSFFFAPSPSVRRVIFIGTPHRGSSWSRRLIGRLGSRLVREPPERVARHDQLVRNNPGVFAPEVRRRIPTSVDLLSPDSPLLAAIASLRVREDVPMHSIIGTGSWMVGSGPSDGVVPVSSARHPGVASELVIDARHTDLHRDRRTVEQVSRILRAHAACVGPSLPVQKKTTPEVVFD